jgi:Rrf2 family protein
MIGIGRHTDYATRIILHLSMLGAGAQITADEVARKRLLPRAFVRSIIRRLGAAGILRTSRGAGGGISLARPPAQISLFDIVQAMEGGLNFNACVENPSACPLAVICPVQSAWTDITAQIADSLKAVRFDHLAKTNNNPGHRASVASKARARKPARPK